MRPSARLLLDMGESTKNVADEYGMSPQSISDIRAGRSYAWVA